MLPLVSPANAAMPSTAELAQRLLHAHANRQRLAVTPDSGPADSAQAYAVQLAVWRELSGNLRPVAWKIGAPDRTTEPTAAAVLPLRLANSLADSPALFAADKFFSLGIEAEIAVRFGCDLPKRKNPYTAQEVLAATASLHVAMELVDTRLVDPEAAGPLWRLADSLLNGGLVLGVAIPNWRELNYSRLTVRVHANHRCLAETVGRQPLDDLFHCLPWWLSHNGGAHAGDIVTTGAWNGCHAVTLPAEVSVEFVGVGVVSAQIR